MGLIGKAKALGKKIGKLNPKAIFTKVGKVAHSVIGTADKVLGKIEDVGNKIAKIPIVGDTLKGIYKAPILKGVSAEMLFKGAKTGVGIAKTLEGKAQGLLNKIPEGNLESIARNRFSNKPLTNIDNNHLHTPSKAKLYNDVIANAGRHPVIQSRIKGIVKHLQAQEIMRATPDRQISNVVKKHIRHNVVSRMG